MFQTLPSEQYIQNKFKNNVRNAKNIFSKKKFKATYQNLGRLTLVEFQNENDNAYYLKFIFDKKDSTIYISGDLGAAVFSWYSNCNSFWTLTKFAHNTGYFIEKRQTETDIHIYDAKLAKLQIKETYAEINDLDFKNMDQESQEKLKDFFDYDFEFTTNGITTDSIAQLHTLFNTDWIDDETDYGRMLDARPIIWLTALTEIQNRTITFIPKR